MSQKNGNISHCALQSLHICFSITQCAGRAMLCIGARPIVDLSLEAEDSSPFRNAYGFMQFSFLVLERTQDGLQSAFCMKKKLGTVATTSYLI